MHRLLKSVWSSLGRILTHWITLVLVCAGGAALMPLADNNTLSIPFAIALVALVALMLFALTRRVAFSIYGAWGLVAVLTAVSGIKYKMKGFSLHFYDAVVMAGDREMYWFLLTNYPQLVLPVLAALVAGIAAAVWIWRLDRPVPVGAAWRLGILALPLAALPLTYPAEAQQARYFYYLQGRHVTAFFVSLLDIGNLFGASDLEGRLAGQPKAEPFDDALDCGAGPRPDVFLVLAESQTDPSIFPQIAQGRRIADDMAASTGTLNPLQVETFGGGTWISNLSLMTGLSSTDFGWRSPYLTITLQDRVAGALPEVFARCGYRTAAVLPLNYTFVNEGPFLSSIGFETVLDKDAIGATSYHMRDKVYFDAADAFIAEHRRTDKRPLFMLVQTMFPHSPYNETLEPDIKVDGAAAGGDDAETTEYLRRLAIAHTDLADFMARRRAQNASAAAPVFVTFGDHQAFVTKRYVDDLDSGGALADPRSLAYRTFYAIEGGATDATQGPSPTDIAFLGTHVLRAAGIAGNGVFRDLAELEARCEGIFHLCADRAAVDRHLNRRIASGLLSLSGAPLPARAPGREDPAPVSTPTAHADLGTGWSLRGGAVD